MPRTVGIDLGTTYSLIAYQDKREGQPKCIPGPYGTPLCPSVVSVDTDGSIVVGQAAQRRLLTQPERTIYSVKRLMGRGPADVQDELKIFPFRIDPVLEPIGFGFAQSLGRYLEVRRRYPDVELLMGVGNLTELTDADSAGVNVLLCGICQELGIRSVLTTQVIHWARRSVRECDLARRLVYHAIRHRMLPKHREPRLVMLRGSEPLRFGDEALDRLAAEIKDNNYRVFAEDERVHLVSAGMHMADADPGTRQSAPERSWF